VRAFKGKSFPQLLHDPVARRSVGCAARAAQRDAPDPPSGRPSRRRRSSRPPGDQHSGHRSNVRHRRQPAACRGGSPRRTQLLPTGLLLSEHLV
jgi:hypothetical protein